MARGENEATLWSTSTWTALWTISLPSTGYFDEYPGGVAIAPDGKTAVVSAGFGVSVIDLSGAAIVASRPVKIGPVMELAYAWNGRRIVVVEATMKAHCIRRPNGGDVDVLDSALSPIATVSSYAGYGSGQLKIPHIAASPSDDLVVTTVPIDGYSEADVLGAFRVSDGARLAAPPVVAVPSLFTPNGRRVLYVDGSPPRLTDFASGRDLAVLGSAREGGGVGSPVGMSTNGATIAFGGGGAQLLRIWGTTANKVSDVCAIDLRPSLAPWSGYPTERIASQAVSPGGTFLLEADQKPDQSLYDVASVTLWRRTPQATLVRTFARRADAATLHCSELPVAITADGARAFTGAAAYSSCYSGPKFELHVHDVASGRLIDSLPPDPSSIGPLGTNVAYGFELWCAP